MSKIAGEPIVRRQRPSLAMSLVQWMWYYVDASCHFRPDRMQFIHNVLICLAVLLAGVTHDPVRLAGLYAFNKPTMRHS